METKIIYRKPIGEQDRFVISTTYKRTKDECRSLELLEEMYVNTVDFCKHNKNDAQCKKITVLEENFSPEQLRMKVYAAILEGAKGIEYKTLFDGVVTKGSTRGSLYRYVQDLNYRITQYGRTLMALKHIGIYCTDDMFCSTPINQSKVLAEQELPRGLAIGEFEDEEGNLYLMIQNTDFEDKSTKAYTFQLKKDFRVYRVNPHDGKQMISKDSIQTQKILIMPGDADLLRYQDVEKEACFIEYALKK